MKKEKIMVTLVVAMAVVAVAIWIGSIVKSINNLSKAESYTSTMVEALSNETEDFCNEVYETYSIEEMGLN